MGGQALLHHERRAAPGWMQLALASTALMGAVMSVAGIWGGAALTATGLATLATGFVVWMLFAVLRVSVTSTHVHVQYGTFGPKIPLAGIESVGVRDYQWLDFGGWGIRKSLASGETMYNMPGDGGRALRIVWRDAAMKRHVTNIGLPEPERAQRAIERGRASLPAGASVRELPSADR
jgi:hypothetical protein